MNCTQCQCELNEETGYKRADRASGYQSLCKSCFSIYCTKRWRQRKRDAIEYKGGSCSRCGYNKCIGALEFHHLDPLIKDANWDKIRLWSWDRIKSELDKCILVCANCHREIHSPLQLSWQSAAFVKPMSQVQILSKALGRLAIFPGCDRIPHRFSRRTG